MQVEALSAKPRFDIGHLARRFLGTLRAVPLSPAEQRMVAQLLRPEERPLFWAQSAADQRHAHETMRRAAMHTDAPAVLNAALLHDVGKAVGVLGPWRRSLATLLEALGAPLSAAMATYRSHGELGAAMLEAAGASELAIDFARRHPDPDPGRSDAVDWAILLEADDI